MYYPVTSSTAKKYYFKQAHKVEEFVDKTRLMLRFNFHYGVTKKREFYFSIGGGIKWVNAVAFINEGKSSYKGNRVESEQYRSIAFRLANGFRFRLSDHFLIVTEL